MKKIKAIIFDLGAVLLNISYQKTINEFERIGIKNADIFYSKKTQTNLFNLLETGEITEKDFIKAIKEECKNAQSKDILNAWNAMLLDLPEIRLDLLKELKNDYPIYLLSNTNAIHINAFRKNIGEDRYNKFYNLFNKVYYSHEIGYRKPHKEAFQLILNENKLNAKEVLFIDDSPQHIEGAKKLGINTHHLIDGVDVTMLFPGIIQ